MPEALLVSGFSLGVYYFTLSTVKTTDFLISMNVKVCTISITRTTTRYAPPPLAHRLGLHINYTQQTKNEMKSFVCFMPDCKRREIVEVRCPHCERVLCLQHRHQVEHSCPDLSKKPPRSRPAKREAGICAGVGAQVKKTWSPAKGKPHCKVNAYPASTKPVPLDVVSLESVGTVGISFMQNNVSM